MSEERLGRVEAGVDGLRTGVDGLRADFKGMRAEISELRTDISELRTDMTEVRADISELRTDMTEVRAEIVDLRRHMLVLHEDTMGAIKALAPDFVPIRREFTAADAALEDRLDQRIVPLEAYVQEDAARKPRNEH